MLENIPGFATAFDPTDLKILSSISLKSKGFKWSPTKKAWQNFRNNQRLIEIKKYIETIGA